MKNRQLDIKCQKTFGNFKLNINLNISPSFTAVFGSSGAGKTTFLNLVAGLLKADTGVIKWNGRVLTDSFSKYNLPPYKRSIGYVFQDSRLFPHKSVYSNLKYGWNLTPEHDRKFAFETVVDILGLKEFVNRKPATLSGGEKQRVALGMALLASPDLLLMDEPLAALDRLTKLRLLGYLKDIHLKLDLPILYVSHDLATVINFANDAILINEGNAEILNDARKVLVTQTENFFTGGIENIFKANVKELYPEQGVARIETEGFSLLISQNNCKKDDKLMIEIPASEIILATIKPESISARNIIKGVITAIHSAKTRCLVDIDIGKLITAEILQMTKSDLGLNIGMEIYVIIKAKCVHIINE